MDFILEECLSLLYKLLQSRNGRWATGWIGDVVVRLICVSCMNTWGFGKHDRAICSWKQWNNEKNKLCTIFFSRQFLQQISFVNKNPAQFLLTVVYCTQINYTLSYFGVIRPLWHWVNVWQVVSAVVGQCSALGFLSLQNNNHIRAGYFYFRLLFMGVCNILDPPQKWKFCH